jgi:hypothetical protein
VPVSPSTGFTTKTLNAGEMRNEGIELGLRATPVQTETGLKIDLFGTFTKVENTVVSINEGVEQILVNVGGAGFSGLGIVAAPGRPYGSFYGTAVQRDPATGNVVVDRATGLPVTDPVNRYFGSYLPDYQASLGANVSFKGLSLNVLFDTKQGGQFYSRTSSTQAFVGTSPVTTTNNRQPFVYPNSVIENEDGSFSPNTNVTLNPYSFYTGQFSDVAEFNLVDASFVKFREASLNYTLPTGLFGKGAIRGITVGIFGNNLFLWTPKENTYIDPEINSQGASNAQGFDFSANPSLRNFGASLRITL